MNPTQRNNKNRNQISKQSDTENQESRFSVTMLALTPNNSTAWTPIPFGVQRKPYVTKRLRMEDESEAIVTDEGSDDDNLQLLAQASDHLRSDQNDSSAQCAMKKYPCQWTVKALFGLGNDMHYEMCRYATAENVMRNHSRRGQPPMNKMLDEWRTRINEYCKIMLLRNPGGKGGEHCLPTCVSSMDGLFSMFTLQHPDFPYCSKTFRTYVQQQFQVQAAKGTSCVCADRRN